MYPGSGERGAGDLALTALLSLSLSLMPSACPAGRRQVALAEAFAAGSISRDELFVTSKLGWGGGAFPCVFTASQCLNPCIFTASQCLNPCVFTATNTALHCAVTAYTCVVTA